MHNKLEIRLENNIDYVEIKKFFRGKLTDRLDNSSEITRCNEYVSVILQIFSTKISKKRRKLFPPFLKTSPILSNDLSIILSVCLADIRIQPISEEGKDRGRARTRMSSVCTDSSFSICSDFHGIRFVFAFATRCVVTACDDRRRTCHGLSPAKLANTLIEESRRRVSPLVDRPNRYSTQLVRYLSLRKFHWFRVWRLGIPILILIKEEKKIKYVSKE